MATELFKLMGTIAIDATNATQTINGVITAGVDLEKKLNEIGDNAYSSIGPNSGFNAAAVWLGNMLTDLTRKAAELGKTIWNTGFNMNLNMESWTASFKTYLGGDLEAAEALVERLKQFAIDTPLSLQEVMAQATQLLATGTEPDKLIEVLGMLGDVSRGDMSYFSRISTAYWQIMTTGRLLAQDANQLTQAGVPVWQLVADYFNAIERDGRTDWEKGDTKDLATQAALLKNPGLAISSEELYSALLFSTSETGMYFNAMNNAMDTTKGKLEKLNDAFAQFAASLTQPFTDVMGSETLDKMTASFDRFIAWAEENPAILNNLATALSALATNGLDVLLGSFQGLLEFWNNNRALFDSMLVLLGALAFSGGFYKTGTALIAAGAADSVLDSVDEVDNPDVKYADHPNIAAAAKTGDFSGLTAEEQAIYNERQAQGLNLWGIFGENLKKSFPPYLLYTMAEGALNGFVQSDNNPFLINPDDLTPEVRRDLGLDNGDDFYGPPTPEWFKYDNAVPDGIGGSNTSFPALIASVQSLTTAVQGMTGEMPGAISAAVSRITVTGSITTGDVKLNDSTLVGRIMPQLNLKLGWQNKLDGRGA